MMPRVEDATKLRLLQAITTRRAVEEIIMADEEEEKNG
jgi:hypothetical protein